MSLSRSRSLRSSRTLYHKTLPCCAKQRICAWAACGSQRLVKEPLALDLRTGGRPKDLQRRQAFRKADSQREHRIPAIPVQCCCLARCGAPRPEQPQLSTQQTQHWRGRQAAHNEQWVAARNECEGLGPAEPALETENDHRKSIVKSGPGPAELFVLNTWSPGHQFQSPMAAQG